MQLHEFSSQLHAQFTFDGDAGNLPSMLMLMMEELYKIINICLGTPPTKFNWNFKNETNVQSFTPMSFYQQLVMPFFALDAQICLGHDPRLSSSYHRNYRIAYSSNMIDGLQQCYNNQSMDVLLEIMVSSLAAGSAVWLACDLQSIFNGKSEVLSLEMHNFEQVFGMPLGLELDKAQRLVYKGTRRNTALLLTEVTLDALKQPLQFRTLAKPTESAKKSESHTSLQLTAKDDGGDDVIKAESETAKRKKPKGNRTALNVDWLREYAFEIVIDSRFVPPGVLHVAKTRSTIELPIWDPMGGLLS